MSDEEEDGRSGAFGQYIGSDEDVLPSSGEDDGSSDNGESSFESQEEKQEAELKKSIAALPFESLLKARGKLSRASQTSGKIGSLREGVDQEVEISRRSDLREQAIQRKRKAHELGQRSDKHAPTEVSSRKPVGRRREVVETAKVQRRDPRFSSLTSGPLNKDLFNKSYGFVNDLMSQEITTLRSTLSSLKAKERTQAGPKARSEYALQIRQERERVEMALRRAESKAAERERRTREEMVDKEQKQKNKERVKAGLQPFYLKKSEKKELLLKQKFEQLSGGPKESAESSSSAKRKLRKAMEKRRKKNAAKERKTLPFTDARASGPSRSAAAPQPKRLKTSS
ncbi:DUF947-domain-containing protein [Tilletiaria anomala UBC 951]|uniref:rRNA biogenesis protein RRP36 n=1 Tax=Tilletiaria anomala (strain ATCC 24038 / CBS 436.72 / UBC 951) TaxID=1037660 RepID=A0A066WGN5_TILAU|nr:DUF947-domain-containing protein [Tilletiaria anomala UBC 951]KDN52956.1 DUF947-domain-containing protein [Tilletiaria anomala UBC 951]